MPEINFLAVAVAAVIGFVFSAVYYALMSPIAARMSASWAAEQARPGPAVIAVELVRSLIVACAVAVLASLIGVADIAGALALAIGLWIAFPVVLLAGSVMHERVPWRLAAIHAGDWLAKLAVFAVIVTIWR